MTHLLKTKKKYIVYLTNNRKQKNRTKEPTKADSIPKNVSKHDGQTRQWKKRAKTLSLCCTKPKIRTHRNSIRQQNAMAKKNDVKNFMAEKSQLNWSGNTATK